MLETPDVNAKIRSYLSGNLPFRRTSLADELLTAALATIEDQQQEIQSLTTERTVLQARLVDLYDNVRADFVDLDAKAWVTYSL